MLNNQKTGTEHCRMWTVNFEIEVLQVTHVLHAVASVKISKRMRHVLLLGCSLIASPTSSVLNNSCTDCNSPASNPLLPQISNAWTIRSDVWSPFQSTRLGYPDCAAQFHQPGARLCNECLFYLSAGLLNIFTSKRRCIPDFLNASLAATLLGCTFLATR